VKSTSLASRAAIVSVGDELLAGDVPDTNSGWLARELEELGFQVLMIATLPDDRPSIARFIQWAKGEHEAVIVSGGLGGTPDDVTRDAVADALGVQRRLDHDLAQTFEPVGHAAAFAAEWCTLPLGSRPVPGASGGAPAFAIANVYVFPGMPNEMRAAFASIRDELRSGPPRSTWRRVYATTEDRIATVLMEMNRAHREVRVGSYPRFQGRHTEVEVVMRSRVTEALASAVSHLEKLLASHGVKEIDASSANRRSSSTD
jgi:nicotinamide-nucleotide amidase